MSRAEQSEVEVAAAVVRWLSLDGWTVYQEVQEKSYERRADIVAVRAGVSWIIEVKRSFSFALLDQAWRWTGRAHFVSVACGGYDQGTFEIKQKVLGMLGIGCIRVRNDGTCCVGCAPRMVRRLADPIERHLLDQHRTWAAAGNASGDFYSPFAETCRRLAAEVGRKPGQTLKQVLGAIGHHYSTDATARSALWKWLLMGKVKGVVVDRKTRPAVLKLET